MSSSARLLAGGVLVLSLLPPRAGSAQVAIGTDTSAVHGGTNAAWGFGIDGRFGYRTSLPRCLIVHSVIFQFETIGGIRQLFDSASDIDIKTLGGGLRIGGALAWFEPTWSAFSNKETTKGVAWGLGCFPRVP